MGIIVVGGNELKRKSFSDALNFCGYFSEVIREDVESGENNQPIGEIETERGARQRGKNARILHSYAHAWVGAENGIRFVRNVTEDWTRVALLLPNGVEILGASKPVIFPEDCVKIALESNGTKTVGSVIAEKYGCDPKDPHAFLTGGKHTRASLMFDAFVSILQPFKGVF